jgi:hypothetical protein
VREGNIAFWVLDAALLRAGLALGLAVLAAGCQQKYWYQEGRTFDECKADHENCWTELLKRTNLSHTSTYKSRFLENCMQQRGYGLMAENDLPLDAKREDPIVPSDTPWIHSYGVAGALRARPLFVPPDCAPAESATWTRRQSTEVMTKAPGTSPW